MKTDGAGEASGMPGQAAFPARTERIAFFSSGTVKLFGLPLGARIRTPSLVSPSTLYPPTDAGAPPLRLGFRVVFCVMERLAFFTLLFRMARKIARDSNVGDVALGRDERTQAIVMIGEIGGAMEEEAAEYAAGMTKPMVAFIAGAASPPGKRMGHAGAIVMGNRGTYAAKKEALEAAGVAVLPTPGDIGRVLRERMGG